MSRFEDWTRWHWLALLGTASLTCWGLTVLAKTLSKPTPEMIVEGRELFVHEWTAADPLAAAGDGLGPVFNASSCVACHFQGGVGGAGPNERNVMAFNALPHPKSDDPKHETGVIHSDAIADLFREDLTSVQTRHPIIKGTTRVVNGCSYEIPDFNPVLVESINTPALFGSGLIDQIPAGKITSAQRWRALSNIGNELTGEFNNIPAGRVRVLEDGRVGRFGWKGQFATLEEFVATACAVEVGLTNPLRAQDIPRENREDEDAGLDLDKKQFRALVPFCKTLPAPRQVLPTDFKARALAEHGERLFTTIGCASCHTPDVGEVAGVYSDFLLHALTSADDGDYEEIPEEIPRIAYEPAPHEWKTPPLWGVADTAPYMHDGSAKTLSHAILKHGGQSKRVREEYTNLTKQDQEAVLAFLNTLKAPLPAEHEVSVR